MYVSTRVKRLEYTYFMETARIVFIEINLINEINDIQAYEHLWSDKRVIRLTELRFSTGIKEPRRSV